MLRSLIEGVNIAGSAKGGNHNEFVSMGRAVGTKAYQVADNAADHKYRSLAGRLTMVCRKIKAGEDQRVLAGVRVKGEGGRRKGTHLCTSLLATLPASLRLNIPSISPFP